MSDWGTPTTVPAARSTNADAGAWNDDKGQDSGYADHADDGAYSNGNDHNGQADADNFDANGTDDQPNDDNCFGCGKPGHRRAECPEKPAIVCHNCHGEGHIARECPEKPAMTCENCGEEGHMRKECVKPRKINRDHVADVTADAAWQKIKQAAMERDVDDAKEGLQEYVKALNGAPTFPEIQQGLIEDGINFWFIALEKPILGTFTNMDLQGNLGKTFSISYRFSEKPERPREIEGWPKDREEILTRLEDAGDTVSNGLSKCSNCGEIGHVAKACPEERVERTDAPKISCYNCGEDGHRLRDCPKPRVDKFACKNCGQSGHRAADCEEPPNLDLIECRKCNEKGHFSRDCPQGGGSRACRNCGSEDHMAKECDQPRNMDNVTCRNCEETGHFSRDCPKPRDYSKVQCSNCQEYGHTKVRCKQPPKEDDFDADQTYDDGAAAGDSYGADDFGNSGGAADFDTGVTAGSGNTGGNDDGW